MKKIFVILGVVFAFGLTNCNAGGAVKEDAKNKVAAENTGMGQSASEEPEIIYLTEKSFKEKVFNYDVNKEWKYEGTKPAVVDFYADWCAPCRQLSPMLEELAKEYGDKIIVYKVDTEKEKELTRTLGISGLPTLLFIPEKGKPQMRMGLVPKASLAQAIDEILLTK